MASINIKIGNREKTVTVVKTEAPDDEMPALIPANPPEMYNYNLPPKTSDQTFETYWAAIAEMGECTFCGQQGHNAKGCPTLKSTQCVICGFTGHTPKKCNKSARAPDGRVGRCTMCKGDAKWGHWLLTCPVRQAKFGDFIFPENVDQTRALAPVRK